MPRLLPVKLHTKRWRKRGSIICLFIILLVCKQTRGYAQTNISIWDSSQIVRYVKPLPSLISIQTNPARATSAKPAVLSPDFYTQTIGYFCMKEIQMERAVKVPVRFRLGSVAYTDKMENKNNFRPTRASKH